MAVPLETQAPPWWTEADQAECDALLWELINGWYDHLDADCASCERVKATGGPCPHLDKAVNVVIDWKKGRNLLSYAVWLRDQRRLLEFARDVRYHAVTGTPT